MLPASLEFKKFDASIKFIRGVPLGISIILFSTRPKISTITTKALALSKGTNSICFIALSNVGAITRLTQLDNPDKALEVSLKISFKLLPVPTESASILLFSSLDISPTCNKPSIKSFKPVSVGNLPADI